MDVQPEKRKDIDAAVHSRQKTEDFRYAKISMASGFRPVLTFM